MIILVPQGKQSEHETSKKMPSQGQGRPELIVDVVVKQCIGIYLNFILSSLWYAKPVFGN